MIAQQLEAVLFAAGRPLPRAKLAGWFGASADEVERALTDVAEHLNRPESGVRLVVSQTEVALATAPEASDTVRQILKKDQTGELTRPSLETLAIVAYRGPISKAELEQIRGVNCSLILRNLLLRGLIEELEGQNETRYGVTVDLLRYFGVERVEQLPDFSALRTDDVLATLSADV